MNYLIVFGLGYLIGRMATGESLQQAVAGGARQVGPLVDRARQIPIPDHWDPVTRMPTPNPEGWIR